MQVINNFIEHNEEEFFCCSVRDIRKRKMEEELLRTISEGTASVIGEDYFRELAKFVTSVLNDDWIMMYMKDRRQINRYRD